MVAIDFPDTPTNGQVFDKWTWNGTVWVLTAVKGKVAYATTLTGVAGITTPFDIPGLSVTWTADPARTYRTSIVGAVYASAATNVAGVFVQNGATTIQSGNKVVGISGYVVGLAVTAVETGLSGSQTRKATASLAVGTGTISWYAAADWPSYILVEDI